MMNSEELLNQHKLICEELNKTYEKKNHDYGNSFGETYDKLGIISAVTRISDKNNRLVNLCTTPQDAKVEESLEDTLLDMANYCIMTVMEMRKDSNTAISAAKFDGKSITIDNTNARYLRGVRK